MVPNIFLFGAGKWSNNYINLIKTKYSHKLKILCIISQNSNLVNSLNVIKDFNEAIVKYGIPDGFIISTDPNKNKSILSKIIKFNKPIIIEKPICFPKDFSVVSKLLSKTNTNLLVNHFYFFHESIIREILNFKNQTNCKIKIIDGNKGPIRDYSPFLDWAPHALGLVCYFQNFNKNIEVKLIKKIKYINKKQFNIYIRLFDKSKNNYFDLSIGNNFKKKIRLLRVRTINETKIVDINKNIKNTPMDQILKIFIKKIDNPSYNYFINTKSFALQSINLINKLKSYL